MTPAAQRVLARLQDAQELLRGLTMAGVLLPGRGQLWEVYDALVGEEGRSRPAATTPPPEIDRKLSSFEAAVVAAQLALADGQGIEGAVRAIVHAQGLGEADAEAFLEQVGIDLEAAEE